MHQATHLLISLRLIFNDFSVSVSSLSLRKQDIRVPLQRVISGTIPILVFPVEDIKSIFLLNALISPEDTMEAVLSP